MAFWTDCLERLQPDWQLAQGLWAQTNARYAILLLVAAGVLFVLLPGRSGASARSESGQRSGEVVSRPTNTAIWRRLWWKVRPPHDLMVVDGLVIDRTRKPHCAWLGPTGGGKSASVATVRVNGERPMLLVTPDTSDPLVAQIRRLPKWFHWTACGSKSINVLNGTRTELAAFLTEVFRSGGIGAWKRSARLATAAVIGEIDDAGEPRTLKGIGEGLKEKIKKDRNLSASCALWVDRFLDLAEQLGDSIGPDGVDIAELLKQGYTVLLDNDAFEHPAMVEDIVALGLAEAKRAAPQLPNGFRLVFEEAGQLGDRIELAAPFFRAGRRRKIMVDVLTQAESDLQFHGNDAVTANIATRVYFAQELLSLQKVAADRLGLKPSALDPASMRDFTAWIAHGKIRRLVRFPKPRSGPSVSSNDGPSVADGHIDRGTDGENGRKRRMVVRELRSERARNGGMLALPPPSTRVEKVLRSIYPEGECERWGGKHDKDGYGLVWLDGRWQKVHRVRWELAYGPIPLQEDGTRLTIDHNRSCAKDCSKLAHLTLCGRGENSKRRWRVRGVGA